MKKEKQRQIRVVKLNEEGFGLHVVYFQDNKVFSFEEDTVEIRSNNIKGLKKYFKKVKKAFKKPVLFESDFE